MGGGSSSRKKAKEDYAPAPQAARARRPSLDTVNYRDSTEMLVMMTRVLEHPEDRQDFEEFLKSELASEAMDFLKECDDFELSAPICDAGEELLEDVKNERLTAAQTIVDKFLVSGAAACLRVPEPIRAATAQKVAAGECRPEVFLVVKVCGVV